MKPSNVMLIPRDDGGMLVKIVDFGVAKLLPTDGDEVQRLTQTGELIGSPVYMSPEQWLGQPQDARSDIYAIGCLMYEALTGKPPLVGSTLYGTMYKHLNEVPQGLGDAVPDAQLREQLEQIVFKAMAKEPERRYQNMVELADALDRAGRSRGLLARMNSIWETSRLKRVPKRARSALVVGLMAAVIGLLGLSGWALNALFSSPPERFVPMEWAVVPEPAPPMPRDFTKKEKMADLMITLIANKNGQEAVELIDRMAQFGRYRKQYHLWASAVPAFERSLYITSKTGSSRDMDFYHTQLDLADCCYELGRYQEAERLYPKAIDVLTAMMSDLDYFGPVGRLGEIYLRLGNLPKAEKYLSWAKRIWQGEPTNQAGIDPAPESALRASQLGDVYRLEGNLDEAAREYSLAIDVWRQIGGDIPRKDLAICLYYLAEIQRRKGNAAEAARFYKEALDVGESALGTQRPYVANMLYSYSDVLWRQNRWLDSLQLKARANSIRRHL